MYVNHVKHVLLGVKFYTCKLKIRTKGSTRTCDKRNMTPSLLTASHSFPDYATENLKPQTVSTHFFMLIVNQAILTPIEIDTLHRDYRTAPNTELE